MAEGLQRKTEELLERIESVMAEYDQALTIRQIYYRLVADHGLENSTNSYKRIVDLLGKARLSGRIDFDRIEDRTREISEHDRDYESLPGFTHTWYRHLTNLAEYYHIPLWHGQPHRVMMLVEKQALQGIFAPICEKWQVDLMVCRGYPSLTQQYELSVRIGQQQHDNEKWHIVYFGDFDPSGENIPEKLEERLDSDFDVSFETFRKEALTYDQVMDWGLPPAPAKRTDSRTAGFVDKYGVGMQVELDAIRPAELGSMIETSIARHYDAGAGRRRQDLQRSRRDRISSIVKNMDLSGLQLDWEE
jgi:hypothetical protein